LTERELLMDSRGVSRIAVLMYVMAAVLVIYGLIKTVPVYMDYYAMDDEVAQQIHLSTINTDDVIMADLNRKVEELGLPVKPEDIKLEHSEDGSISIHIQWVSVVDYGYGFKREFPFDIDANSKKTKG
jgi:hypothetical protein